MSRIVEDNWDVDETPTTASAIQAKVRKGWPPPTPAGGLQLG